MDEELKTARLTLLVDPRKKAAFERVCKSLDVTPSQLIRKFIRDFLEERGVEWRHEAPRAHDETVR